MVTKFEAIDKAINMKKYNGHIDVVKMATSFGIDVYNGDLDSDINSWIEYDKEQNKFNIIVNRNHSPQRQYFSISHEIGHYILHRDIIKEKGKVGRQDNYSLDTKREKEADELGAEIIMPKKLVDEYAEKTLKINANSTLTQEIINKISRYFDVSKEAVIIRLRNLGYYVPYISFG